jgi:hypothetical protein
VRRRKINKRHTKKNRIVEREQIGWRASMRKQRKYLPKKENMKRARGEEALSI